MLLTLESSPGPSEVSRPGLFEAVALFESARSAQKPSPMLRQLLADAMQNTPQGKGSVLSHCLDTAQCGRLLLHLLDAEGEASSEAAPFSRVPPWLWHKLRSYRPAAADVPEFLNYLAWHDCGKPFCFQPDAQERPHYPNHAEVSAQIWASVGGAYREQQLMRLDMAMHTLPAEDLAAFATNPLSPLLLLSSLAALEANKEDFGGQASVSFKIKTKKTVQRAKALFKAWETQKH